MAGQFFLKDYHFLGKIHYLRRPLNQKLWEKERRSR